MDLTYENDCLPAIAAIAGQMIQIRQDDIYIVDIKE